MRINARRTQIIALCIAALPAFLSLSACSPSNSALSYSSDGISDEQTLEVQESDEEPEAQETEADDTVESQALIPLDEVEDLNPSVYIEQDGLCSELEKYCSSYVRPIIEGNWCDFFGVINLPRDDNGEYSRYGLWSLKNSETGGAYTFAAFSLSGSERLVTTLSCNEAYAYPILDNSLYSAQRNTDLTKYSLGGNNDSYAEVNGIELDNTLETLQSALDGTGILMMCSSETDASPDAYVSRQPTSVVCGAYEGTNFVETEVLVDTPCFVTWNDYTDEDKSVTLAVEKTKDGYFFLDTSELSTGDYLVSVSGYFYLVSVN